MAEDDSIAALIAFWRADGVELRPPASIAALDALERKHSIRLPPDFRELYQRANGMTDYDDDRNFVSFWSLERIDEENGVKIIDSSDGRWVYVAFADAVICAPVYWLRIAPDGQSQVVTLIDGFKNAPVIAGSIRELAAAYPEKGLIGSLSDLA